MHLQELFEGEGEGKMNLTQPIPLGIIPLLNPMEGWDMKGSCKEYKPNRWRARIWHNGDRFETRRTKHGDIMEGKIQ